MKKFLTHLLKLITILFRGLIKSHDDDTILINMIDYPSDDCVVVKCDTFCKAFSIKALQEGTLYDEFIFNKGQNSMPFCIKIYSNNTSEKQIRFVSTYMDGDVVEKIYNGDNICYKLNIVAPTRCLLEKIQLGLILDETGKEYMINLFTQYEYDLDDVMNRMDYIDICDDKDNLCKSFDGYSVKRSELTDTVRVYPHPAYGYYSVNLYTNNEIQRSFVEHISSGYINVPVDKEIDKIVLYKHSKQLTDAIPVNIL